MVRKCRKVKGIVEASSTYMQLRSRRIIKSSSSVAVVNDDELSPSPSSCCASNVETFIDLEEEERYDETETSTYQRSMMKSKIFEREMENSADFDSTAIQKSTDCCCSGRGISPTAEEEKTDKPPTEMEIEEFFMEAEKQLITDKFRKKYNFDFEKEKPLEGRYEWVKVSETHE